MRSQGSVKYKRKEKVKIHLRWLNTAFDTVFHSFLKTCEYNIPNSNILMFKVYRDFIYLPKHGDSQPEEGAKL